MEERYYYAIIDENGVCVQLLNTFAQRASPEYIRIQSYDETMLNHKMWTGSEWVDNPNYVPPDEV